jgi:two-component system response regulator QseB
VLPAVPHPSPDPTPRLLLVSDDAALAPALAARLRALGLDLEYRPVCGDGSAPLRAPDHAAALVDLRRDVSRGLALIEGLRHARADLRLLALLPSGSDDLPLRAGTAGADDFCQGDDPDAIVARVRWLLRGRPRPEALTVGDLVLDPANGRVRRGGRPLQLPRRQQALLELLMRHAGDILSRARIEAELALVPGERRSNLVEVHVHHLRRQLGPGRLLTLRGQGYRLVPGPLAADETERTLRE